MRPLGSVVEHSLHTRGVSSSNLLAGTRIHTGDEGRPLLYSPETAIEYLFSYGTLRGEEVQLATFGRRLEGRGDALPQYSLRMITVADEEFVVKSGAAEHKNLRYTADSADFVEGMVFEVTSKELEQADAYEPEGYERVLVQLKSGINAWVYFDKRQTT